MCEHFPNCFPSGYEAGELTRDGKHTYKPVCAGRRPGGCEGQDAENITQFNLKCSISHTPRSKGFFGFGVVGDKIGPFRGPDLMANHLAGLRTKSSESDEFPDEEY
jgi:hypothetical protein